MYKINVGLVDEGAVVKGQAVAAQAIVGQAIGNERLDVLARLLGIEVALIQQLKGHFTGLGMTDHSVMVEQARFGGWFTAAEGKVTSLNVCRPK